MICVADEISLLAHQKQRLHQRLNNLRGQRSLVKEHKHLGKELATVLRKRQNLQTYDVFELAMPVYRLNFSRLGIVKELKITPRGMGEVWVSWNGLLQIPEQPNLLQIDGGAQRTSAIAFPNNQIYYRLTAQRWQKLLQLAIARSAENIGNRIRIVDGHRQAGGIFSVNDCWRGVW